MIVYKLIRQDRTTRYGFKYPPKGERLPELSGRGDLCSDGFYHGYAHPLLAVLHAPLHVEADYTKMIEIEVPEVYAPDQMKLGFTTGVVGKVIPLPKVTDEQKIRYAIGSACSICQKKSFREWADNWISGKDRSRRAVKAAKLTVSSDAWDDKAAFWVIKAIMTAENAWFAKFIVGAARAAVWAAWGNLDLIRIAEWAVTNEPLSELLGGKDER